MTKKAKMFNEQQLKRLILPLIVEQFLAISAGIIDTIMVSSIGESAVSGLSLVDSINILLINIFAALASGGAVVASQFLGKNNREKAKDTCKQLVYAVSFIAIIIMILCLVFRTNILLAIFGNVNADIMDYAITYFILSALSYPFIALYNSGAAIFRSMGNSKMPMQISLLMSIVNIIGNSIFIFVFHMGVVGAGLATLFSRILGAVIILYRLRNPELQIYIEKYHKFHFDFSIIKKILQIGIPSGFENGIFQAGKIVVQSLISTFGAASIAANAVIVNFSSFMIIPGAAMGLAMITVVGQCVGANEYEQAKYYIRKLMKYAYLSVFITTLCILLLKGQLYHLYSLSDKTMSIANELILICAIGNVLFWPMAFTFPNSLRASNDATYSMIISIISMFLFRVGLSYVLAYQFDMQVDAVYYAMLVDWVFRGTCFFLRYKSGRWMYRKLV
ncbi:putative MATE family efflux protein [Breznakia sp. PF5-3]|uniref:MATE family efflux transporter n=1 Tax=unclassified Breznakia TaxID=2623764 RepID=UPI002405DBC4|nr:MULTISPECIES: MATE family efflux transporter [unclassified Breznakia]MDF9824222.1 putative MATE family efflux protein [Breznakia sp. PM6-1]MDF9835020.1 putative MATE family efflux protein [Breznakia sp. PF5-3]MDF9837265.1 putative MATE family efflux protein [Breznakia sp. PFB2-8]MDF9859255.1 putative MATE family efflux protein [Breznakia sp. PH5-24]